MKQYFEQDESDVQWFDRVTPSTTFVMMFSLSTSTYGGVTLCGYEYKPQTALLSSALRVSCILSFYREQPPAHLSLSRSVPKERPADQLLCDSK